jgi:pimeloyl-ACP methyl ester carboxylesterase
MNDPDALTIDVGSLAGFTGPALLTQGTESPAFFGVVLDKIAPALVAAQRHTIAGAGHTPHMSHPAAYADALARFTDM